MSSPRPALTLRSTQLVNAWDESPTLRSLVIAPGEWAGAHIRPGQYVTIARGGLDGHFALASAPGAPGFELLVKRGGEGGGLSDELCALPVGAELLVSPPAGRGYPMDEHQGHDLVLLAAGSGIAPIRAALQHALATPERFGALHLYYGQRRPGEHAYARDIAAWRARGVRVVEVVSDPGEGWTGARGYVQNTLLAAPPPLANAVCYVCGPHAMVDDARRALGRLGLPEGRLFLNY